MSNASTSDTGTSNTNSTESGAHASRPLSGVRRFLQDEAESRHSIWPVPTYLMDYPMGPTVRPTMNPSRSARPGVEVETEDVETEGLPLYPIEQLRDREAERPADEVEERRRHLIATVWQDFARRLKTDGRAALDATYERLEKRRRKLGRQTTRYYIGHLRHLQRAIGDPDQAPSGPILDLEPDQYPARALVDWRQTDDQAQLIAKPKPPSALGMSRAEHDWATSSVFFDYPCSIADLHAALRRKIHRGHRKIDADEALHDWIQFQHALLGRLLWLYDLGGDVGGDLSSIPASTDTIPSGVRENLTAVHQARAIIEAVEAHDEYSLDDRSLSAPTSRKDVEELINRQLPGEKGNAFTGGASRLFSEVLERDHAGFEDTLQHLRRHRQDVRRWSQHVGGYGEVVGDPELLTNPSAN